MTGAWRALSAQLVVARLVHDGSAHLVGVLCRVALVGACVLSYASRLLRPTFSGSIWAIVRNRSAAVSRGVLVLLAATQNTPQQLPRRRQRRHERFDLGVRHVGRQGGTAGGRDAEVLHQRAGVVRALSYFHSFRLCRITSCSWTCSPLITGGTAAAFPAPPR